MSPGGFECPACDIVASRRYNLVRHLIGAHKVEKADAEQVVGKAGRVDRTDRRRAVTAGHLRSLAMLEDLVAVSGTVEAFKNALGGVGVLLRPVDAGLTVMSLDIERCASMISVGSAYGGGTLTSLPPSTDLIRSMVMGYEIKRDSLARGSVEELFSLRLIAGSLLDNLRLAGTEWIFVAHEWRVHLSNGSNGKIDLLAFDPSTRRLVAIELKASENEVRKPDANGWDAARQADEYGDAIWRDRADLYPFFDRLIAAQTNVSARGLTLGAIDLNTRPTTAVWWPDPVDDHTPPWPAWNAAELAVPSDAARVARYRRHQSWFRESVLGVAPGLHPKVPSRRIGSLLDRSAVEANGGLNFVNDAARKHAEQRARQVRTEGGTLEPERLFENLLSSMPMCFNLFGALAPLPAFGDLIRSLFDETALLVDRVVCEAPTPPTWKDRTAFDAQVDYRNDRDESRFLAIETKYTEPFTQVRYDRDEYRMLTDRCGWFLPEAADVLVEVDTNQLWRGLLLMNSTEEHLGATGRYVVISPRDDDDARAAVEKVNSWLDPAHAWRLRCCSLEDIVEAARGLDAPELTEWAHAFGSRYLIAP